MEVAPGIYRVQSGNEVIYALACGEGCYALIDVGSEPELPAKLEELGKDGIDPKHVGAVFITHFHHDHCGALPRLRQQAPARVVTHRLSVEKPSYCVAVPGIPKELVDYTVDDGDQVEIGNLALVVRHLPGHTPDSVAWQLGQDFFAFAYHYTISMLRRFFWNKRRMHASKDHLYIFRPIVVGQFISPRAGQRLKRNCHRVYIVFQV